MKNKAIKSIQYLKYKSSENTLSPQRLINLLFLADWFSQLKYNKAITNINWKINKFGLFIGVNNFPIIQEESYLFNTKDTSLELDKQTVDILDIVLSKTDNKNYSQLVNFVGSTYPLSKKTIYSEINLKDDAKEYVTNLACNIKRGEQGEQKEREEINVDN